MFFYNIPRVERLNSNLLGLISFRPGKTNRKHLIGWALILTKFWNRRSETVNLLLLTNAKECVLFDH